MAYAPLHSLLPRRALLHVACIFRAHRQYMRVATITAAYTRWSMPFWTVLIYGSTSSKIPSIQYVDQHLNTPIMPEPCAAQSRRPHSRHPRDTPSMEIHRQPQRPTYLTIHGSKTTQTPNADWDSRRNRIGMQRPTTLIIKPPFRIGVERMNRQCVETRHVTVTDRLEIAAPPRQIVDQFRRYQ